MDAIVAFIIQFWSDLMPFKIIQWYERGAFLRPGKEPRLMLPGFYLKWPFYDTVYECIVTNDTICTKPVYITTLDGKTILLETIFCIDIVDAMKHIIYTNEGRSNFHDTGMGVVSDAFTSIKWEECIESEMKELIKDKVNERAGDMGVRVNDVYFKSIAICRIIITKV
jgi:regulator of protease activity HflC (stomatin/prohibitin superfamily)